ncbi:MAG: HYR domain-containing protein [Alteromonas sp.]|nr:HYR domain-containing protein [Alteromonas sp.]
MKKILLLIVLAFPLMLLSQNRIGKVAEEVVATKVKPGKFKPYELFNSNFTKASGTYKNAVREGIVLDFSPAKVAALVQDNPREIQLTLPINERGQTITLELFQKDIFASSFSVRTSDGRDITNTVDRGKHYRGIVAGKPHSLVGISIFNNEVMGFISYGEGNYVIGRLQDSESKHIIYNDRDLLMEDPFSCSTPDDGPGYTAGQLEVPGNRDPGDVVCIYIEAGQSVFNSFGGNLTNTTNFLNGVFAECYTLYANEGIAMQTSDMLIWTTADPYNGANTTAQLNAFQAQTSSINGNLGHLVEVQNIGGLAAGFSGICAANVDNSLCFSGFSGTNYNTVPTFSFNVMIITHEMGHLLGSRHTHACVWNGNNTAIDGCAGFTEGGCPLPPSPPGGGTIMSYCHNDPVGVDFTQGFGPQPNAVIVNTVNTPGNCLLGSCSAAPANDLCANAEPINCGQTLMGDTSMATFDGVGTCGTSNTAPGVWYSFTGQGGSVTLSTCNQAAYDTKISVFSGSCAALTCVAGNDDGAGCGGFTSEVTFPVTNGTNYLVLVHGFGGATGTFSLSMTCLLPPANDLCTNAEPITCGQTVSGNTTLATFDNVGFCGTSNTAPGVWYTFTGTGSLVNLSTCNQAAYDTKITVFSGSCAALVCEDGNDDGPGCSGFTSDLDVCTTAGTTYYVLVHGFSSAVGAFDLTLTCDPPLAITCPPTVTVEGCSAADAPAPYANITEFEAAGGTATGAVSMSMINETSAGVNPVIVTRTYEFTDVCGNTATCDHTIEVEDTIAPVIACAMDVVVNNDPGVCGAAVSFPDALATDACGIASVIQTMGATSGSTFPIGTTTIEFTATDNGGNTNTCSFTITVNDVEDPTITCGADVSVDNDSGVCGANVAVPPPTAMDNCPLGGAPVTLDSGQVALIMSPTLQDTPSTLSGATTVTSDLVLDLEFQGDFDLSTECFDLQGPDGSQIFFQCSNGSQCSVQTRTINVTAATWNSWVGTFGSNLTFTLLADPQVNANLCGGGFPNGYYQLSTTLPASLPIVNDYNGTDDASDFYPVGTTVVTWTVTDASGNTATCMQSVTVNDTEAPDIVCNGAPATVIDSQNVSPNLPINAANTTVVSTMDVTDDVSIEDLDVFVDIPHTWVGDLIVQIQSPAGTSVTIIDQPGVPASTFGCSGDDILATLDDEAATPVEDECAAGVPTINGSFIPNNPLSAFDGESTLGTWTLTVIDTFGAADDGTLSEWGIVYTHSVAAAPYVVDLDANGMATINASDLLMSASDNCGNFVVTVGNAAPPANACATNLPAAIDENLPPTEAPASIADSGIIGVDYVLDQVSLDITHTFDGDLDIELISPAGTVLLLSDQNGGGGDNYTGTIFQDGGADITAASAPFTGIFEPEGGTFAATYGGEDINGDWTLRVTDNFGGDQGTLDTFCINFEPLVNTTIDFTCADLGLNEIEVTATDDAGNSSSCIATVEVRDVTDPILVCQDVTIVLDENGMAEINPEDLLATAPSTYEAMVIGSDNQSGTEGFTDFTAPVTDAASISFDWVYTSNDTDPGFDSFGYLLNGVYTQLTNPALGNQSGSAGPINVSPGDVFGFRSQTDDNIFGNNETVVSNFAPGFSGQFEPANWTLNLVNSDGDAFFVEIPGGPLSYDNCGITVLAVDVTDVTCADIGTPIVVTVFASDASGNLASCTSIVTVVDESGPTIECPGDMTVDPGANNLFYELPDYWGEGQATATDNCTDPVTITSQDPAAGTLVPDGVYTITLCAEDEYGNESCCTFELTVESVLGIDDDFDISTIVIYPNPASATVNLSNPQSIPLQRLAIYDVTGKFVMDFDLSNMGTEKSMDISKLATASYLVVIQGAHGQITKQLIKE